MSLNQIELICWCSREGAAELSRMIVYNWKQNYFGKCVLKKKCFTSSSSTHHKNKHTVISDKVKGGKSFIESVKTFFFETTQLMKLINILIKYAQDELFIYIERPRHSVKRPHTAEISQNNGNIF